MVSGIEMTRIEMSSFQLISLPNEVLLVIFKHLDVETLFAFSSLANSRFNALTRMTFHNENVRRQLKYKVEDEMQNLTRPEKRQLIRKLGMYVKNPKKLFLFNILFQLI